MDVPAERYLDMVVEFLEEIEYGEPEGSVDERAETLRFIFHGTIQYFSQSHMQGISLDHQQLMSIVRTITRMTVFGWGNLPRNVMLLLNIYYSHAIMEDDPEGDPFLKDSNLMDPFVCDLVCGNELMHPRYRAIFRFLPDLLRHYGKFSQLTMLKSTLEYIQGSWIESHQFQGFAGASEYSMFLRRLNGLGDFSGAALFPIGQLDEDEHFGDIVTVVAHVDPVIALVNDVFSFYKEENGLAGDICLVNTLCVTEGIDVEQALRRIIDGAVRAVRQLRCLFERRQSASVLKVVNGFVRGYVRWHLCDERYRMKDLVAECGSGGRNVVKFQRYREIACRAGCVDLVDFRTL
ncbi:phytoene synthase [Streptomyces sp. NBRC 110611]|uniref:hypothetical protein n=1 Tax=Streptomyces sp. NBRC 110611 TaxID=1621259 RepID=UPI00082E4104|nr:hypothetical protein [Streptomyces sp. NBRC 110611]GAU70666.1 phytoene synthase [Streptomyces sp. NBRC 110611]